MPKQETDAQSAVVRGSSSDDKGLHLRDSLIGQYVIRALGPPDGLHLLQVRPLWGHCFRVNVLVGPDAVSAKVVHSYFLVTDGLGKVVESTPKIVRRYGIDDAPREPAVAASAADEGGLGG